MDPELAQLRDIHLPNAISMWPIAPGWIVLCILFLIVVAYLLFIFYRNKKRKKAIRYARAKLKELKTLMVSNPDKVNIAAEVSTLLRRTALYYFKRDTIAGLTGKAWISFLNKTGETTEFNEEIGYLLNEAPYRKVPSGDVSPLFALTEKWLMTIAKKHRIEGSS